MATLQMISWKQMVYYCRYIPRMVHLSLMLILICFGAIGHGFNDAAAKKVIEDSPLELHNEVIWQPKQSWTPIVSYYTWNPIPRTQIHAYSRKLLAFNKYSVSPPTLSKVLPILVSLPTTSPPQSPTSTKEGANPTLRVYPPLPSHAPYYGNSYVASLYDRLRSPPQTIPIIAYAPDQSPKQAKVPSLQSLDHGYLKSPIVVSRAHMPTSSAESSLMPLPVPLPNPECGNVCMVPYTKTPLGSPCGCVIPLKVELELDVALYVLFPQISVLSGEIAEGTLLSQKQVRIVGAKSDKRDQAKSIVTVDLLPLGKQFDNISVLLIFQRFWKHDISLNTTLFGNYMVRFVHYPGLPLSPSQSGRGGLGEQPFAVNVKRKRSETNKATIALIALSSVIAVAILLMALWFMILKFGNCINQPPIRAPTNTPAVARNTDYVLSSETASSTTLSFVFSVGPHTGSAKSFTLAELERATEKFKPQNMVGEGGSSRVYRGVLDDGIEVAVKVLTRDDQQGRKRFISEVEMLSRLHHRNLVKLLGICTEHSRCLVYELVMNGSVESHLHGVDQERSPLDWDARMRIALGAARGLAYIHEDSNPGVVHRDFKAANILLEDDFTPKISDFELAKDVSDEPSSHISTRVMGTFGYIAPEYVMTGHLLVKSDVYSYGVVLLELLTGRKPVDMSQPPGQENLVTWARPLLANKEWLETLVDPTLRDVFPWESMAQVAAVASMCVQPEVSHRPFMGEVVQALKLVCNDSDGSNGITSANASLIGESPSRENGTPVYVHESVSRVIHVDYESNPIYASDSPKDRPRSASAVLSSPRRLLRRFSCSFRRHSTSGSSSHKVKGSDRGSMSERTLRRPFGTGFGQDIYGLWS